MYPNQNILYILLNFIFSTSVMLYNLSFCLFSSRVYYKSIKSPELWANNSCFLHHDNAPSHTALVLRDHFVKNSTHIIPIWLRVTSGYSRNSRDHSGERVSLD